MSTWSNRTSSEGHPRPSCRTTRRPARLSRPAVTRSRWQPDSRATPRHGRNSPTARSGPAMSSSPTPTPVPATTAGSTSCAAPDGRATARSRGSTRPTAASCVRCTRSPARPPRSATRRRPTAAGRSCGTAARRPLRFSPPDRLLPFSWWPSGGYALIARAPVAACAGASSMSGRTPMPAIVLVGAQWGDEGTGKATDILGGDVDYVVRYQGGNNAGHTVVIGDQSYALHLLPSGVLSPDVVPVIGNGVVIDPGVLLEEIDGLRARGISCDRLLISANAHLIMPRRGARGGGAGRGRG